MIMVSFLSNGDGTFVAAKQATSPADVVSKLVEFGLSSSGETRAFAEEIFARVPRKASGLNVSPTEISGIHILKSMASIC